MRLERWGGRLAALLSGAMAVLLAAELAVRACARPIKVNERMLADADLGFRNPPNRSQHRDERGAFEFVANSLGCRGPVPPEDAPRTGERVLVIGDSFVHGWRIRDEDWMGNVLAGELERAERPVQVYSLCAQDWGTGQELLALRKYGSRVRPSTVVLCLFPANDLPNNALELAGRTGTSPGDYFRPYLVPDGSGGLEQRYALPWRARFRRLDLFRLLEQRWLAGKDPARLRAELAGEVMPDLQTRIAAGDLPKEEMEVFLPAAPGSPWESAWRTTEALVLATREEARELGARLVVLVIPHLQQVEHGAFTETYDAWLLEAGSRRLDEAVDLDLPERRLEEFFHREGIEHLQMLGLLREQVAETRLSHYVPDGHLNGRGHVLMGRAVAARLAEGAGDACFTGPSGPVDMCALHGDPPIDVDFSTREEWPLIGWGWKRWIPPGAHPEYSGWALDGQGVFMARPGSVLLSGILTRRAPSPATLTVAYVTKSQKKLARTVVAAAGEFDFRFDVPDRDGSGSWLPLHLSIEGAKASEADDAPPRLVLRRLRVE